MLIPTVPSFVFQEVPTLTKLQNLAASAAFVSQMPIVLSLKKAANQSVSAATVTAVTWTVSEADSDTMHSNTSNPSRLVAQTQGYYRLHACVSMSIPSAQEYKAYFQQTTGSNNPLGTGVTQVFGEDASDSASSTSDTMSISIRSLTPCLYVGDYVEVYVYAGAACNILFNYQATGNNDVAGFGDGGSCLTGYYAFEGP